MGGRRKRKNRKEDKQAPLPVPTHEKRTKLRKSTGDLSVDSLLNVSSQDALFELQKSPLLGKGVYGQVRKADHQKEHTAVKITNCDAELIGSLYSPFHSINTEPRILSALWTHVVLPKKSPHIIAPLGSHIVIDGVIDTPAKNKTPQNKDIHSMIFMMEYANGCDVHDYLGDVKASQFDAVFTTILFQLCFTLEAIYSVFPLFKHNDLHTSNVMVCETNKSLSPQRYQAYNRRFEVPDCGAWILLGDTDFSCIAGYMDNYKVLEYEMIQPSLSISQRKCHSSDIYLFIKYVLAAYGSFMGITLRNKLLNAYKCDGTNPLNRFTNPNNTRIGNSYRIPGHLAHTLPTTHDLLFKSDLFTDFQVDCWSTDVMREEVVYAFDSSKAFGYPPLESWTPEQHMQHQNVDAVYYTCHTHTQYYRYCSKLVPKNTVALCPSQTMHHNTQSFPDTLDNATYMVPFTQRFDYIIKPELEKAMEQQDYRTDISWEAIWNMVRLKVLRFAGAVKTPFRYWKASYTCALLDLMYENGWYQTGVKYWTVDDWVQHWGDLYTPEEFLDFKLEWNWFHNCTPTKSD